jgi:nicotinamide-nucleotide amidase
MSAEPLEALAQRVGTRLKAAGAKLVTAESCTGGWAAQAVTSVAGSSDWFERGYVTYSNESKVDALGVHDELIDKHGAVSEEVAREMALGALRHSHGSIALAITGVAGPAGGTPDKPVGLVCLAWAGRGGRLKSETRRFTGDRAAIRRQSVMRALEGVLEWLDGGAGQD